MNYSKLKLLENHILEIILQMMKEEDPNLEKVKEEFNRQYRIAKLKAFW